jgi:GntR family transcriptional regulator
MTSTAVPATPLPGGRAPLYSRLRQALRDRITSGEWLPGEQIPTIRELGDQYGVSRITVVQALDALARERLLVRWQGKGVFVGQPRDDGPHGPLLSFSEAATRLGHLPGSRLLEVRTESASSALQARLDLRPDQGVVVVERLRTLDHEPVAIQRSYLPEYLVPGIIHAGADRLASLYRVLSDDYGILPTNASETYEATVLSVEHARLVDSRPGAPALQISRITYDQYGRPLEFTNTLFRGDRTRLRLGLSRELAPLA